MRSRLTLLESLFCLFFDSKLFKPLTLPCSNFLLLYFCICGVIFPFPVSVSPFLIHLSLVCFDVSLALTLLLNLIKLHVFLYQIKAFFIFLQLSFLLSCFVSFFCGLSSHPVLPFLLKLIFGIPGNLLVAPFSRLFSRILLVFICEGIFNKHIFRVKNACYRWML